MLQVPGLLRVSLGMLSEALSMVFGSGGAHHGEYSAIDFGIDEIYLRLATKKNRSPSLGSFMKDPVGAPKNKNTCLAHVWVAT